MNERWKQLVLAEKERRGWSYRKFAAEVQAHAKIRCSHAALAKLLSDDADGEPRQATSHFVPAISALLGIPVPTVDNPELTEPSDPREAELLKAFRKMTRKRQDHLLGYMTAEVEPD